MATRLLLAAVLALSACGEDRPRRGGGGGGQGPAGGIVDPPGCDARDGGACGRCLRGTWAPCPLPSCGDGGTWRCLDDDWALHACVPAGGC